MEASGSSVGSISAGCSHSERQDIIRRCHDSLFAGHLGVFRTVFRLQSCVYLPGTVCLACMSPCPRRGPMGHVAWVIDGIGWRWTY